MRRPWKKVPEPPKVPEPNLDERLARNEAMIAKLTESMSALAETIGRQGEAGAQFRTAIERAAMPGPAGPPAIEDVADEDIEKALHDGQGAALFRRLVDAGVERKVRPLLSRLDEHETAFGELNFRLAKDPKRPHWERFEKEIQELLSAVDPTIRRDPVKFGELSRRAYDQVVGRHYDELRAEDLEAANRAGAGASPGMHRRGPAEINGTKVPDPTTYFSEPQFKALKIKYPETDDRYELATLWARENGYKTAEEFIADELQ